MAPQPQPQQSSPQQPVPANIGQSEPDGMPQQGGSPNMAPQAQTPPNIGSSEPDGSPTQDGSQSGQLNPAQQQIQQRLDALPDNDKKFLSQYLTPEFVYAIGLVSGPDAAQYLNQFTDQNKVLVPVSRQEAGRIQAAVQQDQQQNGQGQQPQGQPQAAPQQAQAAPQQKPQAPMPQAQPPAPTLPNGVTPAPMQGGVMAPRG